MIALVAALALAQTTPAVPELNAQLYRPPVDAERTLWADDAGRIHDGFDAGARLMAQYVHRPFVYRPADGDVVQIVSDVVELDVSPHVAYDRFRLGLHLPIYAVSASQTAADGAGLGDMALDLRATVLDRRRAPLGVAVGGRALLPTATVQAPLGSAGPGAEVQGILDRELGPMLLALNVGARFLPRADLENVSLDDQIFVRLGGGLPVTDAVGVSLDLGGQGNTSAAPTNLAALPIEAIVGGWGRTGDLVVRGGLGKGLTPGIGTPTVRALLSVAYEPGAGDDAVDDRGDRDGDGLTDGEDQCPGDPEDLDGNAHADGCPDSAQPLKVEVVDPNGDPVPGATVEIEGEESTVGATPGEEVRVEPGEYTVRADAHGYEPATTEVVVRDGERVARVVLQPEDDTGEVVVRVVDEGGAPVPAARVLLDGELAGNGGKDGAAEVAAAPGEHAVEVRAKGYAATKTRVTVAPDGTEEVTVTLRPIAVAITEDHLELQGRVYFETGRAEILEESHDLLDRIAATLNEHVEIQHVRVEGHTDARGSEPSNLALSEARARAVRDYLVGKGVAGRRLSFEGFGESVPVSGDLDENRRVEFVIDPRGR